jgi:DUF1680 family protein
LTTDYDLPNQAAYAETCAAIGLVLWSHRMLHLDTDRRYADVLEQALYNGVLSGLSLDGSSFFYENPLESEGDHHRRHWYTCACCPPNVARLLASLGQYVYSVSEDEIVVHLYMQSTSTLLVGGQKIIVKQDTAYPWDGTVQLHIEIESPRTFGIRVRIPGWCNKAQVQVNGEEIPVEASVQKGYVQMVRLWQSGDSITLRLEMPVRRINAHPDLRVDAGQVALQRGPLVYCLETADNPIPLHRIRLPKSTAFKTQFVPTLLGGITQIHGTATVLETGDWNGVLYREAPAHRTLYAITAIPYYAWDHRQPGEMCIWIRTSE